MTRRAVGALVVLSAITLVVSASLLATELLPAPSTSPAPTRILHALPARVVVSLPRVGPRRAQSEGIASAVRLAVEDANRRVNVGNVSVMLEVDFVDSSGPDGAWSAVAERANVEKAAADRSVVAYVGPGTLDAAKLVAPLAAAADLLVVTPTLTHPALTRRGFDDALYDAVHPGGARVFVRTIPSDEVAGRAMAKWAIGRGFVPRAERDDPWTQAFRAAVPSSAGGRVPFLYLGGMPAVEAGERVKALRSEPSPPTTGIAGGAESLLSDAFLERAGPAAVNSVATFVGRPVENYSGAAGTFFRAFRDRYLTDPDPYAIFGYDAGRLILDAIRRSTQGATLDRGAIRRTAFSTKDLEGALGRWSVDAEGDTTYATLQLYAVRALPGGRSAWAWDAEITP